MKKQSKSKKKSNKNKLLIISLILIVIIIIGLSLYIKRSRYTVEELYLKNDSNEKIYAKLYRPKKSGKVPIVIYSHGLGASHTAATNYAIELTKYGIATITFDFRGGADKNKSDGSSKEMSFRTEMEDLEFMIEEVKKFDFVDTNQIILMGSSQGGAISALVSANHPNDIKGTVLLYPALGIPNAIRNWYSSIDSIPESRKMTSNITVGKIYFTDIWDLDVYSIVANDQKDIAIIQGTKDSLVPLNQSEKLNKIYDNSKLYLVEGAGHGFTGRYFNKAMEHVVDYLKHIKVIK